MMEEELRQIMLGILARLFATIGEEISKMQVVDEFIPRPPKESGIEKFLQTLEDQLRED